MVELVQCTLALNPEGIFIMAFGTIRPELILVYVAVAAGAVIGARTQPVLKNSHGRRVHRMTTGAVELLVFSF